MNDKDRAVMLPVTKDNAPPPERFWTDDDLTAPGEGTADYNAGLTSLGFIRAAIRRNRWSWCAMAVGGWLIGFALFLTLPPPPQATTRLLLTNGSEPQPGVAILDAQQIAESQPVATLALQKLGLHESVTSFIKSYSATPVTDRVMDITATAPSSSEAVRRAHWVALEFLQYRANVLQAQQKSMFASLDRQVKATTRQIQSMNAQIKKLAAEPPSPAQSQKLNYLRSQRALVTNTLGALEQSVSQDLSATQALTAQEVKGSGVLDPAAPVQPHSKLKLLLLYAGTGLIAGLVLGLAIVVVRALISNRLRRRDDIARALGAPVKLSIGTVRLSRWLPGKHGLAAARSMEIRRIVTYLDSTLRARPREIGALGVTPVDSPQVAALSLVSLALSRAEQGERVVLADLASDVPAGRLLGTTRPGVRSVRVDDAYLIVAIPERDDVVPVGPLGRSSPSARRSPFTEAVTAACDSSDVLLTLVPLDPAFGGEHLATWATDAVVVVTAGQSSWTKIHAAGEMIRLAGTRLISAVLVGADKDDESLGDTYSPEAGHDAEAAGDGAYSDAEGFFIAVDGSGPPATGDR